MINTPISSHSRTYATGLKKGTPPPLRAGPALDPVAMSRLRRHAILDGCKWDPQVGDVEALAPFPLVMKTSVWTQLALHAERLAVEAAAAEEEISKRPELLSRLGLPSALYRIIVDKTPATPSAGRVIRFDFHYTTEGWRISEANSDVPGGFSEASKFTTLMADHFPDLRAAGNPGDVWCDALAASAGPAGVVAFLSAPGYLEDYQVNAFLASRLHARGCRTHLVKPEQISWSNGTAFLNTSWYRGPICVIVRFYQAEWFPRLPSKSGWQYFFRGGITQVTNPVLAIISESKRFPLVHEHLSTSLPTWQALLPETRDPKTVAWTRDDRWLLKTAFCNNGERICIRELMRSGDWLCTRLAAQFCPDNWIAQQRFESVAISTPDGPRHVCVGIYTVNGRTVGVYARLARDPIIDLNAVDVALLLEDDE